MPVQITVSDQDIDALARLAYEEAQGVVTYYQSQGLSQSEAMRLAYGPIVDTILNRVSAQSSRYGTTIQDVIDKNNGTVWQYSPIPKYGTTWQDIPDPGSTVQQAVKDYIVERVSGPQISSNGVEILPLAPWQTHYINPSDSSAVNGWNGSAPGQGWGAKMLSKTFFGNSPLNADGTVKASLVQGHIFGLDAYNADGSSAPRPQDYTLSYDINGNASIGAGESYTYIIPPFPERKPNVAGATSDETGALNPEGDDNDAETIDSIYELIFKLLLDALGRGSPLVLDLDGDGIELTNLNSASAAYWDIDLDGFAEASGWVSSDDGLLVIDINEDGIINDSGELFGDQTGYDNGFLALSAYDFNQDGLITNEDAVWEDLRVWTDDNSDGYSQDSELHTLDDLLITQIDLGYSDVSYQIAGNDVLQESTFVIDGNTNDIADVYFKYSDANAVYSQDFVFDYRALSLPNARGYGIQPELHVAISLDNDLTNSDSLISLVSGLAVLDIDDIFDETTDTLDAVRDIMFRWAGVDALTGDERGAFVDSRELGFLESMAGQSFLQNGAYTDPYGPEAGYDLQEAFHVALNHTYAILTTQAGGGDLFTGDFYYDIATDSFAGITGLDTSVIDALETEAAGLANTAEREVFWSNVLRAVEFSVGVTNLPGGDQTHLDDAIYDSDNSLDMSTLLAGLDFERLLGVDEDGTTGSDTMNGSSADDILDGDYGNDTLNGLAGHDRLNGEGDDDILNGGTGGDYLQGGFGEDDYIYALGDGEDTIKEAGTGAGNNADQIIFGSGIDIGDLTFTRVGNDNLLISIDTGAQTGAIFIEDMFNYAAGGGHVEEIRFYDTSTYDLDGQAWTLTGTSGNDNLDGVVSGGLDTDTIYGMGGNDDIDGGDGDDILYGGDGNDDIDGGYGNDTIDGGDGDDEIDGGSGNDTMGGGAGNDFIFDSVGDDTYIYVSGHDVYDDNSGTDEIHLDAVWDSVTPQYFKIGNDLQIVFDENNTITIDSFFSGGGAIETMVYDDTTSVALGSVSYFVQGTSGNDTLGGTTGNDTIYGFAGNDSLNGSTGSNGNDTLYGGTGDDTLDGGYGNDYLDGGAGDDDLDGDADDDYFYYVSGHDTMRDLSGTEVVEIAPGWTWEDLTFRRYTSDLKDLVIEINGSNSITLEDQFYLTARGFDTLRLNDGTGDVTLASLQYETHGDGGNNNISGIINGGSINDIMYGLGGNDDLNGGFGDDILYGGDGDDDLDGDYDNDTLDGGAGNDTLRGDSGNDTFIYSEGIDTIYDTGGTDTLWITGGYTINDIDVQDYGSNESKIVVNASVDEIIVMDLRYFSSSHVDTVQFDDGFITSLPDYNSWIKGTASGETLNGDSGDNTIIGYAGNDTLNGDDGADDMHGGDGDDTLHGDDGDDLLHGGDDDDILYGEDGFDKLFGGAGADTFMLEGTTAFSDQDEIQDFSTGDGDALDISDILSGTSYNHGVDDITDWVQMSDNGSDTVVKLDTTGAGSFGAGTEIATLKDITGLTDEAALVSSGNLIAA